MVPSPEYAQGAPGLMSVPRHRPVRAPQGSECTLKVLGPVCVSDAVRPCAGGSAAVPEGEVSVRLYDGAIGPTYLAQAQAQASLSAAQQLAFSADLCPPPQVSSESHPPSRAIPMPCSKRWDLPYAAALRQLLLMAPCKDVPLAHPWLCRDACMLTRSAASYV